MIYIVRHGETVFNLEQRYQGHVDSPLTPKGIKQAQTIAGYLATRKITELYCSDSGRAITTAQEIACLTGTSILLDARLRELSFGLLEGLTYNQAMDSYSCAVTAWYSHPETKPPPGGETLKEMRERIFGFFHECIDERKDVAIVTHGGVCNLLAAMSASKPFGSNHWSKPGDTYLYSVNMSGHAVDLKCHGLKRWEDVPL